MHFYATLWYFTDFSILFYIEVPNFICSSSNSFYSPKIEMIFSGPYSIWSKDPILHFIGVVRIWEIYMPADFNRLCLIIGRDSQNFISLVSINFPNYFINYHFLSCLSLINVIFSRLFILKCIISIIGKRRMMLKIWYNFHESQKIGLFFKKKIAKKHEFSHALSLHKYLKRSFSREVQELRQTNIKERKMRSNYELSCSNEKFKKYLKNKTSVLNLKFINAYLPARW